MTSTSLLIFVLHLLIIASGLPIGEEGDILRAAHINLQDLANIAMAPHLEVVNKTSWLDHIPDKSVHTDHSMDVAKEEELMISKIEAPFEVKNEAAAVGGKVSAGAAIKGSVIGSAIATPIILKAVAVPGIAAGKTAGFFALPKLITANAKTLSDALQEHIKNSVQTSTDHLTKFMVDKELMDKEEPEDEEVALISFDLQEGLDQAAHKVALLKAGAVDAATKGMILFKKGATVAGRMIFKPIAIITGIHLKLIGSGLTFGGKMIAGTGAGIATAGTAVKYTGLGAIGLGASAVSWGLDKSTIDNHMEKSSQDKPHDCNC